MVTEENCLWTIGCIQILVHESKRRTSEIKCESDPGLFMYQYRGTLHGLLVTHVNYFSWGG